RAVEGPREGERPHDRPRERRSERSQRRRRSDPILRIVERPQEVHQTPRRNRDEERTDGHPPPRLRVVRHQQKGRDASDERGRSAAPPAERIPRREERPVLLPFFTGQGGNDGPLRIGEPWLHEPPAPRRCAYFAYPARPVRRACDHWACPDVLAEERTGQGR